MESRRMESLPQVIGESELLQIDGCLWVLRKHVGDQKYDFEFERFFPTRRPFMPPWGIQITARLGAIQNYDALYNALMKNGLTLVNDPPAHRVCSDFEGWYDPLRELTPMGRCYDSAPNAEEITDIFGWPIFIKGARQTSHHNRYLSIIHDAKQYSDVLALYSKDEILHWQKLVIRKYVQLRLVDDSMIDKIPASFEFRCFFWKRQLVGVGNYWAGAKYSCSSTERENIIEFAESCESKINVPFLVIDVAQTADGDWILVECNDAQESGYGELTRHGLWQNILKIEKF